MRALMGLIKDRHGTYYAQRKVPERLQPAVARVLGSKRPSQVFLKKSLGTKDLKAANIRGKLVLAEFDRTLSAAEALVTPAPVAKRQSLNATEIARMAEYVFAKELAWDERFRFGGREELKRLEVEVRQQMAEGEELEPSVFPYETWPTHGLSVELLRHRREQDEESLRMMREALALGDIAAVEDHVAEALAAFGINLAPSSPSYPALGIAVLRAYVGALQAIEQRNAGEPVETLKLTQGLPSAPEYGGTLRVAFDGWNKGRVRPKNTVHEYKRAVDMFIELHGDLPVVSLRKSHARMYREALQEVPQRRDGALRKATLPDLSEWGRKHPEAPKVSSGTVNKQIGAVQAIAGWAHHNGIVPENVPWSDPFHRMRVEEEQSGREPFEPSELQSIFDAPLFTAHQWPVGAKGAAGVWLPLLALFTGARQAEIGGLKAANVQADVHTETPLLFIIADHKAGKRLKTKASERVVPVHPQLVALGFLEYVAQRAREGGNDAWLFPAVAPDQQGALAAWAKWWGHYLRKKVGVSDTDKVFHSFRHGFQDALRLTTEDEELPDALAGRSGKKSVSRTYGAKNMLRRWGVAKLRHAVTAITYEGLNFSRLRPFKPKVERNRS